MRKFLISATAYTGTAELIYLENRLVSINTIEAEMEEAQLNYLYRHAPINLSGLEQFGN